MSFSWGQIFGGKDSKDDLARGKVQADADLKGGYDAATGDYDQAIHGFDQRVTGENAANQDYLASLGVLGPEEQARVQGRYFGDPVQNMLMDRITKANTRRFTAMMPGSSGNNSGAATQSLTNSLLENYRNYQASLQGAGAPTSLSAQAGLLKGKGDMSYGYGATLAGNDINYAKSQADMENTGINNLAKILGAGAEAAKTGSKIAASMGA